MSGTTNFYLWYFDGLGGLGGWFLFFLVAVIAVVWLYYDSSRRRIPASGWKLGIVLSACLMIPTLIWRFGGVDTRLSIAQFEEMIFYLGLLGGVLPPVIAIGYFVTYQGMVGCEYGHVYEAELGQCPHPECVQRRTPPPQPVISQPVIPQPQPQPQTDYPVQAAPSKPKTQAWLTTQSGQSHQLNLGETTLGRSAKNDIYITGDTTVSRRHAKIVEQDSHFRLFDLGSENGTRVNRKLIQSVLLQTNDEIQLGDHTIYRFVR